MHLCYCHPKRQTVSAEGGDDRQEDAVAAPVRVAGDILVRVAARIHERLRPVAFDRCKPVDELVGIHPRECLYCCHGLNITRERLSDAPG